LLILFDPAQYIAAKGTRAMGREKTILLPVLFCFISPGLKRVTGIIFINIPENSLLCKSYSFTLHFKVLLITNVI